MGGGGIYRNFLFRMTSSVQIDMFICISSLHAQPGAKIWELFVYFSPPDSEAKFMPFFTRGERQHCQTLDII